MNIENRLKKLESSLRTTGEEEDLSLLTDEELDRELLEYVYQAIHDGTLAADPHVLSMRREEFMKMYTGLEYSEKENRFIKPLIKHLEIELGIKE